MRSLFFCLVLSMPLLLKAQDTVPPVIQNFWTSDTVFLQIYHSFDAIKPAIKAIDAVDGDVTKDAGFDKRPDTNNLGNYLLTYTASDKSGNKSSESIVVQVGDTLYPVVILEGDSVIYLKVGDTTHVDPGITVSENHIYTIVTSGTYFQQNALPAGQYWINYLVTDAAGNTVCVTRTYCIGLDSQQCSSVGVKGCHKRVATAIATPTSMYIDVYPNPSRGQVHISTDRIINCTNVYTLDGRWLFSEFPNATNFDISLPEKGTYLLQIQTESGTERRLISVQ